MALHVNYEIRWKNYRCFRDTGWIVLKPLTILIGPNNAGKTSVISPILLLNQTMTSRDAITPLVTRGPLIDSGTFKDIVHNRDTARDLFLGFRFHVHDPAGDMAEVGKYPPGALEVTLQGGEQHEGTLLKSYALFDIYNRPFFSRSRAASGRYTLRGLQIRSMNSDERKAVRQSRPVNFLFSPASSLYAYQVARGRDQEDTSVDFSPGFSRYLSSVGFAFEELSDIFGRLSYIGPLRARPRRYYELAGEIPRSVGPQGENTANLLYRRFDRLQGRLNSWVQRFEFGDRIEMRDLSEDLFSLAFETHDHKHRINIADAGFGASQVLPLVVQALAASEGSVTIAEQPEIHLNPRLQCVLADLFADMANSDHRLIVETHSEHLLLRLRRLIADGTIEHDRIAIYFVEREGSESKIRSIPLNKDGHIDPTAWPKGFFEETLRESVGLARAQAR